MNKPLEPDDPAVESRARYKYCSDCMYWLKVPGTHRGPCGHPDVCYPATTDGITMCVYDPPLWQADLTKGRSE
jgi:hypothetical protein